MIDLIQSIRAVYIGCDVVLYIFEAWRAFQVSYVLQRPGPKIVHAKHTITFRKKPLTEVAPDEARPARNERSPLRHRRKVLLTPAEAPVEESRRRGRLRIEDVAAVYQKLRRLHKGGGPLKV